ncbi:Ppx/GppA family phosphatase [Paenalcaligenes niemegkensis]|uniref:Ppx/GppA phosphatase family protein n=1 Tax=Paenalcaligenes niemegkensis TaxID=2895469 RepID=UPI001EE987CB|nr:Ppx/GppA phosphatase family protein [Paenalcaligenes niemegkensis]MCQ9615806.1 Ppx/GppA family phosphatase [Paenalcaligenes niemegkensis]
MEQLLAAVDLGSNSFRLSIGRVEQHNGHAQIYAIDRLNQSVRLATGMGPDKRISTEAMQRAVDVLKRFNERIEGFHPNRVRAVATNTFRVANNQEELLEAAEAALGFPIEIISGYEEARLIYSGISNELPPSQNRRLMIDIGGGSTEVIIGRGFQPQLLSSLYMGCVSYTDRFFADGLITESRMQKAILAARSELEGIARQYRKTGWQEAYGSSGTAKGIIAILQANGMSKRGITLDGMERLKAKLVRDKNVNVTNLTGIKSHRAPVLAAGLAIMIAAFQELKISLMLPGEGALRVGVLYDLLGRDSERDKREETALQLSKRYQLDTRQAIRVKTAALQFFKQLALPDTPENQELERALGWAADLHEVGLSIAHNDYHKHTAYVLEHADMPGFSKDDQSLLAFLTLGHQGKLAKFENHHAERNEWLTLLCLRLAVMLMRRREDLPALPIQLHNSDKKVIIENDKVWFSSRPLSEYTLRTEQQQWLKAHFELKLKGVDLLAAHAESPL